MKPYSTIVKITVNGISNIHIWNTAQPYFIGHPKKWVMHYLDSGIEVCSLESVKNIKKYSTKELKDTQVFHLEYLESKLKYEIEINPSVELKPAYLVPSVNEHGEQVQIYHNRGLWTLDAELLSKKKFTAYSQKGVKLFTVKKVTLTSQTAIYIRIIDKDVIVENKKENNKYLISEVSQVKVVYGDDSWVFKRIEPLAVAPFLKPAASVVTAESMVFKKALQSAAAFFGAIVLLSFLISLFQSNKVEEPQVTTILLPQKKVVKGLMTAAPKGDEKRKETSIGTSGNKKNSGRKGSVAQSKPQKIKKQQPKNIAKNQPAKKKVTPTKSKSSSVSKSKSKTKQRVASHSQKKSGPSSSLQKAAQSLMQGGATSLMAKSRFSGGSDIRSEGQAVARGKGGGSNLSGGAVGSSRAGTMNAGSGSVSGFGGGSASGNGDGGPGSSGAGYGRGSHARVSGQGKSFVSLDESASEVEEGLSKDAVGRVIHRHMSEIRYCYESSTIRNPNVGGRLNVQFKINPNGRVSQSSVARSTVGDQKLNSCIVSRLRTWQFPKPSGGVVVAVTYPFIFKTL